MTRTLNIRKPTNVEMHRLEALLEDELSPQAERRARAILDYCYGLTGAAIAQALRVHPNTIYADLHAFAREGLGAVHSLPVGGAPQQITAKQLHQIWQWAESAPSELGLLDARWTLASFREFVVKRRRLLKRISLEHLRRLLKKTTFAFDGLNASSLAKIHSALRF